MDDSSQPNMELTEYRANEAITSWMSTAASQIFLMQLGFLCYEVGFVKPIWAPSVILKNIEDTFVGILTYLAITHTLSTSTPSLFGIISEPKNLFLIGIDPNDHDAVFIAAVFATTAATIISGGVLERMKNKAYVLWCFLIIATNYSFVAHWVWNPEGWLFKMGFVDGAGSIVVHSTGAIAALIAIWRLGPRRGSMQMDGTLVPVKPAARPIIHAIGAFILWYGWFAFNVASPVAADLKIGGAVGTTGLVTCLSPTCAACSALFMMSMGLAKLSYENLLGSLLGGLVSITGPCFTVDVWASCIIGFFTSPVYFGASYFIREKLILDDPLQILPIHLCCGLYACVMEGIFANNVRGTPGLIYGGYSHFGIQLLGTIACFVFSVALCLFLWVVVMEKCLYRNKSVKVSILDTYLGTKMFKLNNSMALEEILICLSNLSKQMLWKFHHYTLERFNNEQLDFLVAVSIFRDLMQHKKRNDMEIAKAIVCITDTYILPNSIMCVNVSATQRFQVIKISNILKTELKQIEANKKQRQNTIAIKITITDEKEESITPVNVLKPTADTYMYDDKDESKSISSMKRPSILHLDVINERIFDVAFDEVFKIMLPVFSVFLLQFDKEKDTVNTKIRLPFRLENDWMLVWDKKLKKRKKPSRSLSKAAVKNRKVAHQHPNDSLLESDNKKDRFSLTTKQQLELVSPHFDLSKSNVKDSSIEKTNDNAATFVIHSFGSRNSGSKSLIIIGGSNDDNTPSTTDDKKEKEEQSDII